jgi:uncharacterized membrane protein YfcA
VSEINFSVTVVGFIVGVVVGLSGMGGGSLLTPLLILLFGVHAFNAVGSDLVSSVPMKVAGALAHYRQRTLNGRLVLLLSAGGVPGAVVGLRVLGGLQSALGEYQVDEFIGRLLGVALLCSALALLAGMIVRRDDTETDRFLWTRGKTFVVPLVGFAVGVLVSLTSIGSGSLTLPLLFICMRQLGLRRLVGSDIAFAAILIPVAAAGHWRLGSVNFSLALSLMIGSVPGVLLGSKLCAVISPRYFRPVLAVVMVFTGSRLL